MAAEPEAMETIAYTRFVLDHGLAGDLLDLHVALAPCVLGYAEIGEQLSRVPATPDHPYAAWIAAYAGDDYRTMARTAIDTLNRLFAQRGSEARYRQLAATFLAATRLETAFWDMGWQAAASVP